MWKQKERAGSRDTPIGFVLGIKDRRRERERGSRGGMKEAGGKQA